MSTKSDPNAQYLDDVHHELRELYERNEETLKAVLTDDELNTILQSISGLHTYSNKFEALRSVQFASATDTKFTAILDELIQRAWLEGHQAEVDDLSWSQRSQGDSYNNWLYGDTCESRQKIIDYIISNYHLGKDHGN